MTTLPISKLNELAHFHGMTRAEYLAVLINREHSDLLKRIKVSSKPQYFTIS